MKTSLSLCICLLLLSSCAGKLKGGKGPKAEGLPYHLYQPRFSLIEKAKHEKKKAETNYELVVNFVADSGEPYKIRMKKGWLANDSFAVTMTADGRIRMVNLSSDSQAEEVVAAVGALAVSTLTGGSSTLLAAQAATRAAAMSASNPALGEAVANLPVQKGLAGPGELMDEEFRQNIVGLKIGMSLDKMKKAYVFFYAATGFLQAMESPDGDQVSAMRSLRLRSALLLSIGLAFEQKKISKTEVNRLRGDLLALEKGAFTFDLKVLETWRLLEHIASMGQTEVDFSTEGVYRGGSKWDSLLVEMKRDFPIDLTRVLLVPFNKLLSHVKLSNTINLAVKRGHITAAQRTRIIAIKNALEKRPPDTDQTLEDVRSAKRFIALAIKGFAQNLSTALKLGDLQIKNRDISDVWNDRAAEQPEIKLSHKAMGHLSALSAKLTRFGRKLQPATRVHQQFVGLKTAVDTALIALLKNPGDDCKALDEVLGKYANAVKCLLKADDALRNRALTGRRMFLQNFLDGTTRLGPDSYDGNRSKAYRDLRLELDRVQTIISGLLYAPQAAKPPQLPRGTEETARFSDDDLYIMKHQQKITKDEERLAAAILQISGRKAIIFH